MENTTGLTQRGRTGKAGEASFTPTIDQTAERELASSSKHKESARLYLNIAHIQLGFYSSELHRAINSYLQISKKDHTNVIICLRPLNYDLPCCILFYHPRHPLSSIHSTSTSPWNHSQCTPQILKHCSVCFVACDLNELYVGVGLYLGAG